MTTSIISEGSIKFQPHYETELYISDAGYICIKQTRHEEEISVWLSHDQFRDIVNQADDITKVWQEAGDAK